jgi:hypothetical protein
MSFYLHIVLILAAATALAGWCGWGLARLALPPALHPYRGLLAPLLGYALAIVVGYWFVWTISGLAPALAVLLLATGALDALAWRRGGPPRPLQFVRAHWPLLALLIVTLLIGILPLLHFGHPAVIGAGWDIETALPTARYLERGPISAIASAAPNPLRDLVRDPPRIGKTVGFAVWQGSLDVLLRQEAILTFVPLLAWLRALGILAVYVLFRATFGMRRGAALLGSAWISAGALLLWTTYFNFEKQLAAWPLIPLGLLLGVAAVEELAQPTTDDRRKTNHEAAHRSSLVVRRSSRLGIALAAAVALTAQAIAYYPALTLWGPLAIGLAAAILLEHAFTSRGIYSLPSPVATGKGQGARAIPRLLGAAGALGIITTLLSIPTILDYWHGFSYRYSAQLTTLGVFRYIPLTDILGLTPYLHGLPDNPPTPPWALAGLFALAILALAGLLLAPTADHRPPTTDFANSSRSSVVGRRSSYRLRWLGMAVGALAYLAWLRWWQQYPYAYMKGASYVGFVFLGLAAAGWQALEARIPRPARLASYALPLLLLVPMIAGQARIVAQHWPAPGLYPDDFPALLELRQRIPAGSSVTLVDDARTEGVISGLAAYMLDHTTVWGHVQTGYTSATTGAPDALGEYALLPAAEDPRPRGYGEPIWRGGSYALYQRPPGALAHVRVEELVAPGPAFELSVGDEHVAEGRAELAGSQPRRLDLLVGALRDTTIELDGRTLAIPAGGATVRLSSVPTGRTIALRNTGAAPLLLRSATLAEPAESSDAVLPLPAALVASARASADASNITATLESRLADGGPLTVALDIWDRGRGRHYGWYGVELGVGADVQTATLHLDLQAGAAQAFGPAGAALPFGAQFDGLAEGDYSARLQISAGAALLAAPGDLFTFHVGADRSIDNIRTTDIPLMMTTTDRPAQLLDLRAGDDVRLQGYAIDRTSAPAGATLALTLWWQALAAPSDERSVLIHLLDSAGAKVAQADGAPARGGRPTTQWHAGETIVDTHTIAVPPELPPGQYTLVFGMYRWPSLERLALRDGTTQLADDVVRVPITITR